MALDEALRLRSDATLEHTESARVLRAGFVRMSLGAPEPAGDAALDVLRNGGGTELDLVRAAMAAGGEQAAIPFQMLLHRLRSGGWLQRTLRVDGRAIATLRPLGHRAAPPAVPLDPSLPVTMSRFALLRMQDGETLLESPRAAAQVVLHDPDVARLVASLPDAEAPIELLQLFADAAIVVQGDESKSLAPWSFHELLFHARSRFGRHVGGFGGTYRLEGEAEPLPAVKPVTGATTPLPEPTLDDATPLVEAMEERTSIRRHDDEHPIDAARLGELLYRSARVRRVFSDGKQDLSSRPYPSGGSTYELEIYPLVRVCTGVDPGLYRYDAAGHVLELVSEPSPATQSLLEFARVTSVMDAAPQVVLLVTSRFGRVAWKYESIAYSLTLKQVGALFQNLYLVATALGLAPCALGGGDPDAFAAASGIDYETESTVGEFVVGSA
ncbi:MAG TPA: SagB family peptide dehydrogenase [Gaiellaceae bacterium]